MEKVFWTMRNGEKIDIDKMDINHLRNSLKLVVRAIENQKKEIIRKRKIELNGDIAMQFQEQMIQEEYQDDEFFDL
jgi:hypothetical protein